MGLVDVVPQVFHHFPLTSPDITWPWDSFGPFWSFPVGLNGVRAFHSLNGFALVYIPHVAKYK